MIFEGIRVSYLFQVQVVHPEHLAGSQKQRSLQVYAFACLAGSFLEEAGAILRPR